jgi:hypothetical protein
MADKVDRPDIGDTVWVVCNNADGLLDVRAGKVGWASGGMVGVNMQVPIVGLGQMSFPQKWGVASRVFKTEMEAIDHVLPRLTRQVIMLDTRIAAFEAAKARIQAESETSIHVGDDSEGTGRDIQFDPLQDPALLPESDQRDSA